MLRCSGFEQYPVRRVDHGGCEAMRKSFACPICGEQTWISLATKHYYKKDLACLAPYLHRRYSILFATWFRGLEEAEIVSVLCASCGFGAFSPRPTEEEVEAKYLDYLPPGTSAPGLDLGNEADRKRAAQLHQDLSPFVATGAEILDYGGNDGRLMQPFLRDGCTCFLVDYSKKSVPGVVRLGSTVADIEAGRTFPLIVLSHVLEHVAEPLELVCSLRSHQVEGGILYLEVPMELWGQVPPAREPLTHINFFTPPVVESLLRRSLYEPIRCGLKWHPAHRSALVVQAIGRARLDAPGKAIATPRAADYAFEMMQLSPKALLRVLRIDWRRVLFIMKFGLLRSLYRRLKRSFTGQ